MLKATIRRSWQISNALCGLDESGKKQELAAAASYGELKMWFLEQFPEIEQMSENIRKIMVEHEKHVPGAESVVSQQAGGT